MKKFFSNWKIGIGVLMGLLALAWRLYGNFQRSVAAERESAARKAKLREKNRAKELRIEENAQRASELQKQADRARQDRQAHEEVARQAGERADAARKRLEEIHAKKNEGAPSAGDLMAAVRGLGYR